MTKAVFMEKGLERDMAMRDLTTVDLHENDNAGRTIQ